VPEPQPIKNRGNFITKCQKNDISSEHCYTSIGIFKKSGFQQCGVLSKKKEVASSKLVDSPTGWPFGEEMTVTPQRIIE